ncbi:MAG: hypothetical protein JSS04_05770, partial [Proteobacteria bacterium]|nr:hypothetical protein [Pseudomonadota bacterium]
NYLLSAAYFLSGNLANLGTAESVAVGPFAYTIGDWLAGIDAANAAGHALLAVDLFDPARQLTVAALRAAAAGRAFATAAGRPARPVELFLFERLGADALKLLALAPTKPCSAAFSQPPVGGSFAAGIADRPSGEATRAFARGLAAGFLASRQDVGSLPPHLRFVGEEDRAPWLALARQLADGDTDGLGPALAAAGLRSAQFVGFCVAGCGVREAKDSLPKTGAGTLEAWRKWGGPAPDPAPAGALVVTRAGTVGILAAAAQGDGRLQACVVSDRDPAVTVTPIAREQVELLRWLDISIPLGGDGARLGSLSRRFESGTGGPGTVSPGGDAGGVSYGTYQFSSLPGGGTVRVFVDAPDFPFRARFAGLRPGSSPFTAVWRAIAIENPAGFDRLQHDYIKRTHYDPLVDRVKARTGLDVNTRSAALQDCCWSTGVQHGPEGGAQIVNGVIARLQAAGTPAAGDIRAFDAAALRGIYAERGRANPDGSLVHFSNNPPGVQASVSSRFQRELAEALKLLEG